MALEVDRAVFEEAQRRRLARAKAKRMAGKCRICWKRPRRPVVSTTRERWAKLESECYECHLKLNREYARRRKRKDRAMARAGIKRVRTRPVPGVNPAHDLELQR